MDNKKMARELVRITKMIISDDNDIKEEKNVYELLKRTITLPVPRKIMKGRGFEFELKDGTKINYYIGRLVIENFDGIKDYTKLLKELKKHFGKVSAEDGEYIVAEDFGDKYKEEYKIDFPSNPKPLKDIKIDKEKISESYLIDVLDKIDDILKSREIEIKSKNVQKKYPIIKRFTVDRSNYYVLDVENKMVLSTDFQIYLVKDIKEAKKIINLIELHLAIHRELEIHSW